MPRRALDEGFAPPEPPLGLVKRFAGGVQQQVFSALRPHGYEYSEMVHAALLPQLGADSDAANGRTDSPISVSDIRPNDTLVVPRRFGPFGPEPGFVTMPAHDWKRGLAGSSALPG